VTTVVVAIRLDIRVDLCDPRTSRLATSRSRGAMRGTRRYQLRVSRLCASPSTITRGWRPSPRSRPRRHRGDWCRSPRQVVTCYAAINRCGRTYSCRLHGIDPFVYFDKVLRVLPHWPHDRYLEPAPQHWLASRARTGPSELTPPLCHVTVAPPPAPSSPC